MVRIDLEVVCALGQYARNVFAVTPLSPAHRIPLTIVDDLHRIDARRTERRFVAGLATVGLARKELHLSGSGIDSVHSQVYGDISVEDIQPEIDQCRLLFGVI